MIDSPMLPARFSVRSNVSLTQDVFELNLEPIEETSCSFAPGQFSMLYLFGMGEVPISISGDPEKRHSFVYTIRSVGTVTRALSTLQPGEMVGGRGPYGNPWPIEVAKGKDLVLVAGGIGLAPLRPVLYHALAQRNQYTRIILMYGARDPDGLLYQQQLHTWQECQQLELFQTVDVADSQWDGNVGVVTSLIKKANLSASQSIIMMCGPEIMMRFALLELSATGVTDEQIYLSMERNMKCAIGFCGRCQYGPTFLCRNGPVLRYDSIRPFFHQREM